MLKHFVLALMLAGLVCAVSPAFAQSPANSDQPPAMQGPGHGPGPGAWEPAKRAAMLAKKLNLTSDQQAKVQDILKSQQSQMETLRSDSSLSNADRHTKMMEIRKSSDDQIRALLDPDQQKKWDQMQSDRGQWPGHNGNNHNPPPPPPDSEQK